MRKLYINFLFLRGHYSDDGFNWKLALTIYLVLEAGAQQLLHPRVYKKSRDTFVDSSGRLFLILVLVCANSYSNTAQIEGGAIQVDETFCAHHMREAECVEHTMCGWSGAAATCRVNQAQRIGPLWHCLYGLPGVAPLLLSMVAGRGARRGAKRTEAAAPDGVVAAADPAVPADSIVARVHDAPAAVRMLRERVRAVQGFLAPRRRPPELPADPVVDQGARPRASTPPRRRDASRPNVEKTSLNPDNVVAAFFEGGQDNPVRPPPLLPMPPRRGGDQARLP